MDHSIAPQTYAFKLNCPKCQNKVKKLLSQLDGVYSIKVDGEAGRVTVKSTVNKLAAVIGEVMKELEYSCENLTPPPPNEQENNNHMPIAADNGPSLLKGYEGADLQELAKTKKLKQLEFTQTRTLRMTFSEEKDDGPSQMGSDKGTPSEPKKAAGLNHFRTNALLHESKAAAVPTHLGVCPPYSAGAPGECIEVNNSPHCAEFVVSYGELYNTPPLYHHALPPYHGYHHYTLPPYHNHPAAVLPRLTPPEKANDVDLFCDNASKCRIM